MSDPGAALDDLELKKRARRRLVGAAALATFAAVVLPMVMDDAPPPAARDVEIRIPGQDQVASSPVTAVKATPPSAPTQSPVPPPATSASAAPAAKEAPAPAAKEVPAKDAAKPVPTKPAEAPKPPAREVAKTPAAKAAPEAAREPAKDARRAQAILDGQAAADAGAHVILIGAFSDKANIKNLETKLSQLGIKTYTEPLDSPQGKKTRVRAGPFPNREAADKALDRMRRIGVNGIVAPKS